MMVLTLEPSLATPDQKSESSRYGGTLHLASYGKPAPLDPFNVTDTISVHLLDLVFNKLIRVAANGEYVSDLAERWSVSDDGLVYTFYLRQDVKFHDGIMCTSDDVLHTFQLFSNPKISPFHYESFDIVKNWDAPSKFVFRVVLKTPHSSFLTQLWKPYIVPKHRLSDPPKDLQTFIANPVGTGPFQFQVSEKGAKITFLPNEHYFEGRPYLDSIEILPIEKNNVWPEFLRGHIDMVFGLTRENYHAIAKDDSFQIFKVLSGSGYALIFNFQNKLLQDIKIRKAISYAIDRQQLIDLLEDGGGVLANGPFHPQSWAYSPGGASTNYQPEKAMSLLESAGFIRKNGTLQRDNRPLELQMVVDSRNEQLTRMAKIIRQQLNEVGIRIEILTYTDFNQLSKKIYTDSNFQLFLFAYHTGPGEPDKAATYWHSNTRVPYNVGSYHNSLADSLIELARKSYSIKDKKEAYYQFNLLMEQDKPATFLYFPYDYFATSSRVYFPKELTSSFNPLYFLKRVYFKEHKNK